MGALTEIYVDPSIAADSGTGTIGDPFGDVQYALNNTTRDATNGNRFNIKAGTDEILSAALSLTTYGTPTTLAPLVFQGYTSAAGDGGMGGISGNGSVTIMAAVTIAVVWVDMHLHNTGANTIITTGQYNVLFRCELNNSSSGFAINCGADNRVVGCYIHDCANGINGGDRTHILFNTCLTGPTNNFVQAIDMNFSTIAYGNVVRVTGAGVGIVSPTQGRILIIGNSIYSDGGTGKGIDASTQVSTIIMNNIIEGFSGVGGVGINSNEDNIAGYNAFYNNTSNQDGVKLIDLGNDQLLGASPFTDAANNDFTVTTAVKALAFPVANFPGLAVRSYLDIGALQREEPTGGGGDPIARPGLHAIEQGISA